MIFSRFLKYRFILTTGHEISGRVLAWDQNKIVVSTTDSPAPLNRVMIYKNAIALTEPVVSAPTRVG
jgi:sRNA-binding regulator protein Hfq